MQEATLSMYSYQGDHRDHHSRLAHCLPPLVVVNFLVCRLVDGLRGNLAAFLRAKHLHCDPRAAGGHSDEFFREAILILVLIFAQQT